MLLKRILFITVVLSAVLSVQGCDKLSAFKPSFETKYQAIFLDNGQVFFGTLENSDGSFLLLKDVFYVQSRVNKDTKDVSNILLKRGQEWHGPDFMYVNLKHIVLIEPVSPTSRVAKLIKEAK